MILRIIAVLCIILIAIYMWYLIISIINNREK